MVQVTSPPRADGDGGASVTVPPVQTQADGGVAGRAVGLGQVVGADDRPAASVTGGRCRWRR